MTTKKKHIATIVALDEKNGIGRDGGMLCHLPNDLKHFKETTVGHTVIMGRRTYESLPKGALPNRTNVVVTSDSADNYPGCIVVRSVEEALELAKNEETVFIIGGGKLYASTIHLADQLYLTRIHHTFEDADTFFPEIDLTDWKLIDDKKCEADEKHPYDYSFLTYTKR